MSVYRRGDKGLVIEIEEGEDGGKGCDYPSVMASHQRGMAAR